MNYFIRRSHCRDTVWSQELSMFIARVGSMFIARVGVKEDEVDIYGAQNGHATLQKPRSGERQQCAHVDASGSSKHWSHRPV